MKNLFKKTVKKEVIPTIQKLDKNQLEKVIGGADVKPVSTTSSSNLDTVLNLIR